MIMKSKPRDMFTYYPPTGDQPARYQAIRDAAYQFALRKLRECVMTANASIALEHNPYE